MKKRFLPLALSLVMALSLFPAHAQAAYSQEWTVTEVFHPDQYASVRYIGEGLYRAGMKQDDGKILYGAINADGNVILPFVYQGIDEFHEGIAKVKLGDFYHKYVDTKGNSLPNIGLYGYSGGGDFSYGMARVFNNGCVGIIDTTGKAIFGTYYENVIYIPEMDLFYVKDSKDSKAALYTREGKKVKTTEYDSLGAPSEGLMAASRDGKWGYIDENLKEVIPPQYDEAGSFKDGMARVKSGEETSYIDREGNLLFPFRHLDRDFFDGRAAVYQKGEHNYDGRWGYIDTTGTMVIPAQYDQVGNFQAGLASVAIDDTWGCVDTAGQVVIPIQYAAVRTDHADNGLLCVAVRGDDYSRMWGCIDRTGREVLPMEYSYINVVCGGELIIADKDGYATVFDRNGQVVVPPGYTRIDSFDEESMTADAWLGDKCGLLRFTRVDGGSGASAQPTTPTAYASTQSVLVDGVPVEFQCYALKDAKGNDTNYIKLRDVASVLNGTAVQFNVGWDGVVNIETGKAYIPNGSEMKTPFSGDRAYEPAAAPTNVNGATAALEAVVLKDDKGGAFTYYKLRDLGTALGFQVDWSTEKGIFIETK